ncbi:MAG: hypothetical protein AAB697_02265 [Patescibacteria group bacterium]
MTGDTFESDYNSFVHLPLSAQMVKEVSDVGQIYRIQLNEVDEVSEAFIVSPEIVDTVKNRRGRDQLMSTLNLNSRIGHAKWLGKANSAFLAKGDDGKFVIDVLLESQDHIREANSKLHDYLRSVMNNYRGYAPLTARDGCVCLSGHLAPVIISDAKIAQVFSLDKFSGDEAYTQMSPEMKKIMDKLWASRIMPLASNGYPIKPQ